MEDTLKELDRLMGFLADDIMEGNLKAIRIDLENISSIVEKMGKDVEWLANELDRGQDGC